MLEQHGLTRSSRHVEHVETWCDEPSGIRALRDGWTSQCWLVWFCQTPVKFR